MVHGRGRSKTRVLVGPRTPYSPREGIEGVESTITKLGKRVVVVGQCWIVDGEAYVYPTAGSRQRRHNAHRYVYSEVHNVTIPDDVHIHHTCEHPGCIRPDHLVALDVGDHKRVHVGTVDLADVLIPPEQFA